MGRLNLFKVDSQKQKEFLNDLAAKYNSIGTEQIIKRVIGVQEIRFKLSFFLSIPDGEKPVEWDWLLKYFGDDAVASRSNPKGILVIEGIEALYACTYGFSFFVVDKYCDTDFAFDFARRVKHKEIKTTTLISPSSKRNKVVNTYLDYYNLEFDSGESFAKLKVKADLPDEFALFTSSIEIGHSIKFELPNDTIDAVIDVLLYVENTLSNSDEIYKIPVFNKITNKESIKQLDICFAANLKENPLLINLSELNIIGVTEVFNNNDSSFEIRYGHKSKTLMQLTSDSVTNFIQDCRLPLYEGLKKVKIVSYYANTSVRTDTLYNLIDYIDDERRCLLSKGIWYYFNDDYLGYLEESLSEIDVVYDSRYDYTTDLHEQFIAEKYEAEKHSHEYVDLPKGEIEKKVRKKYYRERAYNLYISNKFGFDCHDREGTSIGGAKIELMDLYKDKTLFAVKFGNTSSILCYVIDQSINTIKLYKQRQLENLPTARRFGVWFLLDRRTRLDLIDGKPNINQLEMLALKNKLDAWKKEVRILGYMPVVMINYFN